MKNRKTISILVILISFFALIASSTGIFMKGGEGSYSYQSVRGKEVEIYGKGLYRHMSADVAIQGIAQDFVTLFLAIPLLILAIYLNRKNSLKSNFFLAGILNYIFVTYLFYLNMGMYNEMFLVYVVLTGLSFFAFVITLLNIDINNLPNAFKPSTPVGWAGGFLIFNALTIALLWLGIVLPPLADGSLYPSALEHYTTLTVQAMDLSLLLPISFVGGVLLVKKNKFGYFIATVTLVFLPLLMTALLAKIIAMALAGVNVIPAVFIIPVMLAASILCGWILFKNIHDK